MKRTGLILCAILLGSLAAFSQLSVDWFTIDGGGGMSTGGVYSVSGTIGQPDAGIQLGGPFILQGGFWGIVAAVQMPGAPYLTITQTNAQIVVSWPWPAPGWVLAETNRLEGLSRFSDWPLIPLNQYQTNGTRILYALPAASGNAFFRLEAIAGPVVLGVTPGSGPQSGGNAVTILGQHFWWGAQVFFGSVAASGVSVSSDSALSCFVPAAAQSGTRAVTVINPDGQSFTLPNAYSYTSGAPPHP